LRGSARARNLGPDLASRAKAGIEYPYFFELIQRVPVIIEMFRLPAHQAVPVETEPSEILEDRYSVVVAAPGPVDVLDTQQKASSVTTRRPPPFERRSDMAEMQIPGRARRKSRHR